jgi:hypothetical protein
MALTDADLRELLAQRTQAVPADSSVARAAAVDQKVRVIRRRRAASASFAVVVVLLVAVGLSGLLRDGHERTGPVPAYQQKVGHGMLPRYSEGGEAAAYTTFRTDETRNATFTFTPTSWSFLVSIRCDKDLPKSKMVSVEINGRPLMDGSCSGGTSTAGPAYGTEQARAASLGVRLGEPATVQVRVVQVTPGQKAPEKQPVYRGAMRDYRVGVALYAPMALDDYPFPPRPRKLESLDGGGVGGGGHLLGTVDSRSVGANGQGAVTVRLTPKGFQTEIYAVAPGAVTVSVNDRTIDLATSWTWAGKGFGGLNITPAELRSRGMEVKTGDLVLVAFGGYRFAVPGWRAEVRAAK